MVKCPYAKMRCEFGVGLESGLIKSRLSGLTDCGPYCWQGSSTVNTVNVGGGGQMDASAAGRPFDWSNWHAYGVLTGPLTVFPGGHRHTRAIAKDCEVGAPPWGDGRRLLGESRRCLRRLLYQCHAATCGVPAVSLPAQGWSVAPAVVSYTGQHLSK